MKKLTENIFVGAQLTVEDIALLKEHEIKVIICNRPDEEIEESCHFNKIKEAAEQEGIKAYYLPISTREDIAKKVDEFSSIVEETNDNIYAYCRSGTRSGLLTDAHLSKK